MKRYSFRIIVASTKDDILKLFSERQAYGMQILRLVNDEANSIPQNMKFLAAWCFLEPSTEIPDVRRIIEQIIYEGIKINKTSPKNKTITLELSGQERTFSEPSELIAFLDSQVRTSVKEVSIDTNMEPIIQSPDGKIKIFRVSGEYAPLIAKKLGGDTTWCITKPSTGMYYFYRSNGSTFYFVFDENMKGTPLEKVAVDLKVSEKSSTVELTDLQNRTGQNLTSDIPGQKGKDWNSYSSYLKKSGVDLNEQDENGQTKLRPEPKTQVEIEEQNLLGKNISSLEEFKKLFTNDNIFRNFPSKYLARGHKLTEEQFDWLFNNQNQVNTSLIFQYMESAELSYYQREKIKKVPKFLKRLKAVYANILEQTGQMSIYNRYLFTPEELKALDLSKNNEGIFFFPENYLEPEIIEREFDKDPENFINTMGGRFDMVTPKIKDIILEKKGIFFFPSHLLTPELIENEFEKDPERFIENIKKSMFGENYVTPKIVDRIYEISIEKGENLLYLPYQLFFPKATLVELAQYIAKFPDTNYTDLKLPKGLLLDPKFLKLLSSLGYNGWTKMFKTNSDFVRLIKRDITLLSFIPKEDIPNTAGLGNASRIEEYLAKFAPDILKQIISNSQYAQKFDRLKLLRFSKFPRKNHMDEYDKFQQSAAERSLEDAYQAVPKFEMGELPENSTVNVQETPEETKENPMVGLMKKLDDSGMYGVADKVQNLLKRTVDKTKESLDKLS
jgi:hypothetical protein